MSTAKAEEAAPRVGEAPHLKPNRLEAELLSGVKITDWASLGQGGGCPAGHRLRRVFVSLGGNGVYAADPGAAPRPLLSRGDGEHHRLRGRSHGRHRLGLTWRATDLEGTARAAMAAGAIAMESAETINPAMSAQALKARMGLRGQD